MSDRLIDRKSPPIIMEHIERAPQFMRFETLLANLSSNDELVAMFTQLNTSIADYAQTCISPNTKSQLFATEANLTRVLGEILGPESPIGLKKLSTLLQHDQTRAAGLRHIMAWSILQNVRSSGAPETTLLPPEISECMSSMTGMQADVNGMASYWQSVVDILLTDSLKVVPSCLQNGDKLFSIDGANIRKRH